MASILLLLSELLGGESASVLAANRYMCGQSLGEFRPAVMEKANGRSSAVADRAAGTGTGTGTGREEKQSKEESFDDLALSRIAVDVMWP